MKQFGFRWILSTLFILTLSLAASGAFAHAQESQTPSKVVVLGFDGADARLVEQWMDEGKLPNLAELRRQGTYSRLLPKRPFRGRALRRGSTPGRRRSSTS
jgi:hypothetical protein